MGDPLAAVDLALCEELAERASRGDAAAWRKLVERLWPALQRLVTSSKSMGPRDRVEDRARDVLTALFEKLGAQDGRGLRLYFSWRERHADKTFADWLRIVTTNAVRDHARDRSGGRGKRDSGETSVKRLLNEFASSPALETLGARPPMTAAQTARQLLEFSATRLPADQHRALTQWIEGASFEDIEGDLRVREGAGAKLVRAAIATLRRNFAGPA